jgi:hypothetical protein
MMVPNKPSYVSHKVLGRLFREVRDFEEIMNHVVPNSDVQLDGRLIFPGYDQYLRSAATSHADYASQLQTLLTLYGIETEGEMLSGCFHKLRGDFGRERSQVAVVVRRLIQQLRTEFRANFFREFHMDGDRLLPGQVRAQDFCSNKCFINHITLKAVSLAISVAILFFQWMGNSGLITNVVSACFFIQTVVTCLLVHIIQMAEIALRIVAKVASVDWPRS